VSEPKFFVGIDLGNTSSAVCVLDASRRVVKQFFLRREDVASLRIREAIGDVDPAAVRIGVEDRHNVIVDDLVAAQFCVATINPKQVDRMRDRRSVAGAKDDARDARVLANGVASDFDLFNVVKPRSATGEQLRAQRALQESLDEEFRRLANEFRSVVLRVCPTLLMLCEACDEGWFRRFSLAVVKSNALPTQRQLVAMLKKDGRYCVDKRAADVLTAMNGLPLCTGAAGVREGALRTLTSLARVLQLVDAERGTAQKALTKLLDDNRESDDVARVLHSLPGVGPKTEATLLADAQQLLESNDLQRLREVSGLAPVTKQSGKRSSVTMRRACNPRLRDVMYDLARNAIREPRFRKVFDGQRERGNSVGRAYRSVADAVLRVLMAMVRTKAEYKRSA
jgi:transposase